MDAQQWRTGLLGLDRHGEILISALENKERFDVIAVADFDTNRLTTMSQRIGAQAYDDYRQMILQNDLDCLIVLSPLHACLDHVRLAIKRGMAILKLAPMARTFEEAKTLSELAQSCNTRFDVAGPGRFSLGFGMWREAIDPQAIGKRFMIRMTCEFGVLAGVDLAQYQRQPDRHMAWITDQSLSGGGVLLYHAFDLVDQLILNFGLPEQVYAICHSHASDKQRLHHLSEDVALMTFRLAGGGMAELTAYRYWDDRETTYCLEARSAQRNIILEPKRLRFCDSRGQRIRYKKVSDDTLMQIESMLEAYSQSLEDPQEHPFAGQGQSYLDVMAVLEAAYLSNRTGSPEEPGRIVQMGLH